MSHRFRRGDFEGAKEEEKSTTNKASIHGKDEKEDHIEAWNRNDVARFLRDVCDVSEGMVQVCVVRRQL